MRTITLLTNENVAGAREPSVHAHFIFRFEKGRGNQSFFLSMTKIQLNLQRYACAFWRSWAPR